MAYLRAGQYVWDDGERLHIWVADDRDESGWAVWAPRKMSPCGDVSLLAPGAVDHRASGAGGGWAQ